MKNLKLKNEIYVKIDLHKVIGLLFHLHISIGIDGDLYYFIRTNKIIISVIS